MTGSIRVEWRKLRRSPVTLTATGLMTVLLPLMALGFYGVAQRGGNSAFAHKAGALLVGEGWEGFLGATDQIAAVAVFLGAGIVVAWVFGREHADRTFASLFALPVPRATIAASKLVVLTGWLVGLSGLIVLTTAAIGVIGGVGPLDAATVGPGLFRLFGIVLSASSLALTMGVVASAGRGYLPAIGAVLVVVAVAQVSVLFGTGGWFPYTVPGLLAVAGTEGTPDLLAIQVALVPVTAIVGGGLAVWWWSRAEAV